MGARLHVASSPFVNSEFSLFPKSALNGKFPRSMLSLPKCFIYSRYEENARSIKVHNKYLTGNGACLYVISIQPNETLRIVLEHAFYSQDFPPRFRKSLGSPFQRQKVASYLGTSDNKAQPKYVLTIAFYCMTKMIFLRCRIAIIKSNVCLFYSMHTCKQAENKHEQSQPGSL